MFAAHFQGPPKLPFAYTVCHLQFSPLKIKNENFRSLILCENTSFSMCVYIPSVLQLTSVARAARPVRTIADIFASANLAPIAVVD